MSVNREPASRPSTIREPLRARCRSGLGLIDVVVAAMVLGLAIIPILGLFSTSGRQARQTSDYGLAMALSEKVAEELRLANWENVHFVDQVESDPSLCTETPIVDGLSPFFAAIEDRNPPFGRIENTVDPGISPTFGSLYRQVATFRFGITAQAGPRAPGDPLDLTLEMSWLDPEQRRQRSPLEVRLARFRPSTPQPPAIEDRKRADEQIRDILYPGQGSRTLADVVSTAGGDVDTIRNLGDAVLIAQNFTGSRSKFSSQVQSAERSIAAASVPTDKVRTVLSLARFYERRCSAALYALCYLASPLESLAASFDASSLGTTRPDAARTVPLFLGVSDLISSFDFTLTRTRDLYLTACGKPLGQALRPRVWTRVLLKIVELEKLKVLTAGPADTSLLRRLLTDLEQFCAGRNANFAWYARQEKVICQDTATLERSYPADRSQGWRRFRRAVGPATSKVIRGLRTLQKN